MMKIKFLITGLFLFEIGGSYSQSNFAPVPLRPKSVPGLTTGYAADINRGFVCGNTWFFGTKSGSKFQLHSFDGFVYKKYPSLSMDSCDLNRVIAFRDTILIVGRFHLAGIGVKQCLILKGSGWDTIAGTQLNNVYSSAVVNNKLYVLNSNFTLFEMAHWGSVKSILQFPGGGNNPSLLARDNNSELLIFGADADTIYRYKGGNWTLVSSASKNAAYYTILVGDSVVYMYDPFSFRIAKLGMDFSVENLATLSGQSGIEDFKGISLLNQEMVIGSTRVYHIGTGDVTAATGLSALNGINYCRGIAYGLEYSPGDNTTRPFEITAGASVSGQIYFDKGLNCVKDVADPVYRNIAAYVINANDTFPFFSDDSGGYSLTLPTGLNSFRFAEKYVYSTGILCGIQADTFLTAGNVIKYDLPFNFDTGRIDIGVRLVGHSGFRARQGFDETYSLVTRNDGSTVETVLVTLNYPDSLNFISADVTPVSHTGRELVFDIAGIGPKSDNIINLVFKVQVEKEIGSKVVFTMKTDSMKDLDTANNHYIFTQKVVAAHDPNSKQSSPEGIVYSPVSIIKYQINFQNYGTDTAYRVLVIDSFVPNFPLERLKMTASSHKYHLSVRPGNVLVWEFDNIKLPPTKENVAKSSGFIAFEAPLRSLTKPGQIVSNRAHIYFDYQNAVTTDWNKIIHSNPGVKIKDIFMNPKEIQVYPNPTSGLIHIVCDGPIIKGFVMDAAGATVMCFETNTAEWELDLNRLAPGMYFLQVSGGQHKASLIKY